MAFMRPAVRSRLAPLFKSRLLGKEVGFFRLQLELTQFDTKKANVRARAVREPPRQRVDSSRFPFSTASYEIRVFRYER